MVGTCKRQCDAVRVILLACQRKAVLPSTGYHPMRRPLYRPWSDSAGKCHGLHGSGRLLHHSDDHELFHGILPASTHTAPKRSARTLLDGQIRLRGQRRRLHTYHLLQHFLLFSVRLSGDGEPYELQFCHSGWSLGYHGVLVAGPRNKEVPWAKAGKHLY